MDELLICGRVLRKYLFIEDIFLKVAQPNENTILNDMHEYTQKKQKKQRKLFTRLLNIPLSFYLRTFGIIVYYYKA